MRGGQVARPAHMSLLGVWGAERRVRHVKWPFEGVGKDSGGWLVNFCLERMMGLGLGWLMMDVCLFLQGLEND